MHSWSHIAVVVAALPALVYVQPGTGSRQRQSEVRIEELAALEYPWGMDFLPDGRLLITEKPGRLRIFADGKLSPPVEGLPHVSYRASEDEQGGLLDVAVDPDFSPNRHIYLSYSEEAPNPSGATDPGDPRLGGPANDNRLRGGVVVRATLDGNRLSDVQPIWKQEPKTIGRGHFGHRIVFGRDGTMFITSGDRMRFDPAQRLDTNLGKVVRINRDGSIPTDNPFAGRTGARPDIWSLGHRNILAAAIHPGSGKLWAFEMGPLGGDELNIIERGHNYGWPIVSEGVHYDKTPIPKHSTRKDFEPPIRTWTPVISPSGALFYDGLLFASWRGNAIVGGLSSQAIIRLVLDGEKVRTEERIQMQRRIRDVIQARDGALLVITDEKNGALLRLTPPSTTR